MDIQFAAIGLAIVAAFALIARLADSRSCHSRRGASDDTPYRAYEGTLLPLAAGGSCRGWVSCNASVAARHRRPRGRAHEPNS